SLCVTRRLASWEPPRHRLPLRDEPGDDVRHLLRRQWRGTAVAPPVRHSEIGTSRDDGRSQMLVAHEREVRRISDAAGMAFIAMTPGARAGKDLATALGVAGLSARAVIQWKFLAGDNVRSSPAIFDSADEHLDLLIRQRATGCERKGWLPGSRYTDGDHL